MTNNIVAVQGDDLKKINLKSDTSIFLAYEAQNKNYNILIPKCIHPQNNTKAHP